MKQTVLVVGSGGREDALVRKIAEDPMCEGLYIAPGNAGTEQHGMNVPIPADHVDELTALAVANGVTLVVIGPDEPLALGLADRCREQGILVFGPSQAASKIEWSKAFAWELLGALGISSPAAVICHSIAAVRLHTARHAFPLVIKAGGLARGKGVFICHSPADVEIALAAISRLKLINDVQTILVQEYVEGIEFSLHALTDGKTVALFPLSQDHKTLGENNTGPMTGGMGVIAPVAYVPAEMTKRFASRLIKPIVNALAQLNAPFQGCLYPGLIVTPGGLKVLEVNARFGDPEMQVYCRLLKTGLLPLLLACANGTLRRHTLEWHPGFAVNVVLASKGYGITDDFPVGFPITGIEAAEAIPGVVVYHGATKRRKDETLVTNGGRVLHVTAIGATLAEAIARAYQACDCISFNGKTLRRDIGAQALAGQKQS